MRGLRCEDFEACAKSTSSIWHIRCSDDYGQYRNRIAYIPMTNLRGIYNCIEKMPFVAINSNLTDCERKFVEAHELAHYILHRGVNRVFLNRTTYLKTDHYEREADLFAACMRAPWPNDVLFEGEPVDNLAARLGVRLEVAEMYLNEVCAK